jgi:hypothetical protein
MFSPIRQAQQAYRPVPGFPVMGAVPVGLPSLNKIYHSRVPIVPNEKGRVVTPPHVARCNSTMPALRGVTMKLTA